MLDSSPGNNLGFEGDIKMSSEMYTLLGGSVEDPTYKCFEILSARAYLLIRRRRRDLLALVSSMIDTQLPCFVSGKSDERLQQRFADSVQRERAATEHIVAVPNKYGTTFRANMYEYIQRVQKSLR